MTRLLTKGYAPSLGLIHQPIFALHTAKTTALVTYTFMHKARQKLNMDIQGGINSVMRAGKALDGNLIYFIEPDVSTQYDWFAPKTAAGLTQAGLSRINQSIEAYVYCILGAQVNVRSRHPRRRRESERGPDRVLDSDGRRHKTARLGEKRAKIPARSK